MIWGITGKWKITNSTAGGERRKRQGKTQAQVSRGSGCLSMQCFQGNHERGKGESDVAHGSSRDAKVETGVADFGCTTIYLQQTV